MKLYFLFLLMATVTVMSPGPGVVMTLTNALNYGWRETFGGILGIACGALVVAAFSATSAGVVLATSATAFMVMKFVGVAYLAYLGIRLWRAPAFTIGANRASAGSVRRRFIEGVSLQFTNPKAIIFFLAVFPQFIDRGQGYIAQFFALVISYATLVIVIHSLYAAFAQRSRMWFSSKIGGKLGARMAGTLFILFAVVLAVSKQ